MRAFVAAGARQEPGQQNGCDQPGEGRDLERRGRPAHRQIDRKSRKRHQAAEQPRRHECAVTRARQRIISCRGMQQRIETIADDTQNNHDSRASACSSNRRAGTPPLSLAPPCQSELKRTLRRGGRPANTAHSRRFHPRHDAHSTRMVNDRFRAASIYGFEMVDARAARYFPRDSGHQSKIYAESNHSDFHRIFRDFASMQTLTIYRRLLVRNKAAI